VSASAPFTDTLTPLSVLDVVPPASPVVVVVVPPEGSPLASVHTTELLVGGPPGASAARASAPPKNKIGAVRATVVAMTDARARPDLFPSPMVFSRQVATST